MTLGVSLINFYGVQIPILLPDSFDNISVQIISLLNNDLIPNNVDLVQTSPGQAFNAQLYVAIIVGFIGSIPIILGEVFAFLNPALLFNEKKIIKSTIIPALVLFLFGCLFAYHVVIPYTLELLYKYGQSINVVSFFDITSFIMFVLNFLVVFGFSFQLPLLMWATTKAKIVGLDFWKQNMKYIVIVLVILGAFLTPDGSGLSMWLISGPLIILYVVGLTIIKITSKYPQKVSEVSQE